MALLPMLTLTAATGLINVDTGAMKSFGHSIKNGHLIANTEITLLEHNCSAPPCSITQMHCPTAGPRGWYNGIVRFYIDDDVAINMTLLEFANIGNPTSLNSTAQKPSSPNPSEPGTGDHGPWGQTLFGHTASNGGVYNTIRIPFGSRLKATLESPSSGTFWFIIRGVESYPVVLGDLQLPAAARLRLHRLNAAVAPQGLVTLADIPAGTAGALLNVKFDAADSNYHYLEACMRAMIDGADTPLFLSSGAEDYFLSAYYFNEGEFKTPNSGLTYYDGKGTLSAYKVHDRDPVLFNNGFKLIFRNNEDTTGCGDLNHCPNQYCAPGAKATTVKATVAAEPEPKTGSTATYGTLVWTYEWPSSAEATSATAIEPDAAMRFVAELGAVGAISEALERRLMLGLVDGEVRTAKVVMAYVGLGNDAAAMLRAGRMISALL